MDPQQRLLMEVVYDSLCAAGQPIEKLRGSDTAILVGSMCDGYRRRYGLRLLIRILKPSLQ